MPHSGQLVSPGLAVHTEQNRSPSGHCTKTISKPKPKPFQNQDQGHFKTSKTIPKPRPFQNQDHFKTKDQDHFKTNKAITNPKLKPF